MKINLVIRNFNMIQIRIIINNQFSIIKIIAIIINKIPLIIILAILKTFQFILGLDPLFRLNNMMKK